MNERPVINKPILQQIVNFHRAQMRYFEVMQNEMSCSSCVEFSPGAGDAQGKCNKFNADVPHEVAKVGCDEWIHDDIPF